MNKFVLAAVLIAFGAWYFWPQPAHFTQSDIPHIESEIRKEFAKRDGLKVVEVKMLKERDRKLTGYVKLEVDALKNLSKLLGGGDDATVTKPCSATMGENWESFWRCE